MKKNKIRFHLAKGEHFMHWQVKYIDGTTKYFDPNEFQLVMFECKLRNQRKTADKICYDGIHKTVCAWIEADEIIVSTIINSEIDGEMISYNPRVLPYWVADTSDGEPLNIDNKKYNQITSLNNKLFITN